MYYFTSDEHYNHKNIIKYCNRPFKDVDEMNRCLIAGHNAVVRVGDTTVHVGDFCFGDQMAWLDIVTQLNGEHIFLKGSHDYWMKGIKYHYDQIWEKTIEGNHIVACHYAMTTWPRSHHNSWQVFGHSHGRLRLKAKQWDVGVDCNQFRPVSFDTLKALMDSKPDNPNLIKKN